VPHFPEEDAKLRATKRQVRRGGNVTNSLEVLQNLLRGIIPHDEVALHLIACLPSKTSLATATIVSSFGSNSLVDFSHGPYREDKSEAASSYIIRSQAQGSRTIVSFNDLDEMGVAEFTAIADQFRDEPDCWWHFEVCNRKDACNGWPRDLLTQSVLGTVTRCHSCVHPPHPSGDTTSQSQRRGRES
jgi:ketohexokinase